MTESKKFDVITSYSIHYTKLYDALATSITIQFFPNYAVGLATGVMTFLILVFGEVLPKSVATRNNIMIARATIYPIYWLSITFYPLVLLLNFIPKITGKIKKTPSVTVV